MCKEKCLFWWRNDNYPREYDTDSEGNNLSEITFAVNSFQREKSEIKGLGHTILGNFSTDRMVIELTKISK